MFSIYLDLGFDHILDIQGYDHILFLIALCALYTIKEWKHILILVTAFTIGHSITLAMSALHIIQVNAKLIEVLIPVTIFLAAAYNVWSNPSPGKRWRPNYILALFFGFIHGMGFSNYFKALLGQEADIVLPLFAFNLGVELGQLCIVGGIILINYLLVNVLQLRQRIWTLAVSGIAAALAIFMIIERI